MAYAATPGFRKSPGVGDIMGQGKHAWQPHKTFRLVRWRPQANSLDGDAASLSNDSIVIWDTVSDDGVSVTSAITSRDPSVAGIIVQTALTPDNVNVISQDMSMRSFTWLQTYGICEMKIGTNPITVKEVVGTSTVPGAGDYTSPDQSGSWPTTAGIAGFAMSSGPASGTTLVFLKCE